MSNSRNSRRNKVLAWAKGLKSVGKYCNVDSLLELHRHDTLCTFGTRTSVRKCRDGLRDGDDENLMNNNSIAR